MYVIRVTNRNGDVLYVDSVRKSFKSGFTVKAAHWAKVFLTKDKAVAAIKTFKPSTPGAVFEVVSHAELDNSFHVVVVFGTRSAAERFYFDTPGEGSCNETAVSKCVEGDAGAAKELREAVGKLRGIVSIKGHSYQIEE